MQAYADTNTIGGLTVSPYEENLYLAVGSKTQTQILIRNNEAQTVEVKVSYADFKAGSQPGVPLYFNATGLSKQDDPSVWLNSQTSFAIASHATYTLSVNILVPDGVTPGGHYAAVVLQQIISDGQKEGNLGISGKIAIPYLIAVSGDYRDIESVSSITLHPSSVSLLSLPLVGTTCLNAGDCKMVVTTDLKNSGDIHDLPIGTVDVYDMLGNKVQSVPFNPDKGFILPGSERIFTTILDLKKLGGLLGEGNYTVRVALSYNGRSLISEKSFTSVNWGPIIVIAVIGILVLVLTRRAHQRNA